MITKRKYLLGAAAIIFIAFEGVMFYLIHIARVSLDFNLRYACIIAATVFSWLTLLIELATAKEENEEITEILFNATDGNLIRIAMIFTLVADYFMVAKSVADNLLGVTIFLGTQAFIFLHIFLNDPSRKSRTANLIIRLVLTAGLILTAYLILGESADRMAITSVIYYANLCTNAIFAHRIGRGGIILTAGLVLFALCDINVGLSALNSVYGGFPKGSFLYNLMNSDINLIWLFYIPSQTLIPLTLIFQGNRKLL